VSYDDVLHLLRSQEESYPAPRQLARLMEEHPGGRDFETVARNVGRWYGNLYKNRERLVQLLLEAPS